MCLQYLRVAKYNSHYNQLDLLDSDTKGVSHNNSRTHSGCVVHINVLTLATRTRMNVLHTFEVAVSDFEQ